MDASDAKHANNGGHFGYWGWQVIASPRVEDLQMGAVNEPPFEMGPMRLTGTAKEMPRWTDFAGMGLIMAGRAVALLGRGT